MEHPTEVRTISINSGHLQLPKGIAQPLKYVFNVQRPASNSHDLMLNYLSTNPQACGKHYTKKV
jgi:hypothetical protein